MKMTTKNREEQTEKRLKIRELIYKINGMTDNVTELFLLNAFPNSHETYLVEWINRLKKASAICYMDNNTANIYFSVLKLVGGKGLNIQDVEIKGFPE